PCLVEDKAHRSLYMFNHLEYDSDTLRQEYERDVSAGSPIEVPVDYFPEDDASSPPQNRWRAHGHLLYGNWINQIYQTVPFDIALVGSGTCEEPA
ncbi:MAG: homoserine O-succinyltransferase, partial [Rhodobacteraceae bacterium]|nr:homoserine O-succinyltransferase [Paracoccaceae bacterium]